MKLGDYGLLISLYSKENGSMLCHAAPEVFDGQRELKSDVWSLGITLIELEEKKNTYDGVDHWRRWASARTCR